MLRKGEDTEIGRVLTTEVVGTQGKERPGRLFKDVVEIDMRMFSLVKVMASNRKTGRRGIHRIANPSKRKKRPKYESCVWGKSYRTRSTIQARIHVS